MNFKSRARHWNIYQKIMKLFLKRWRKNFVLMKKKIVIDFFFDNIFLLNGEQFCAFKLSANKFQRMINKVRHLNGRRWERRKFWARTKSFFFTGGRRDDTWELRLWLLIFLCKSLIFIINWSSSLGTFFFIFMWWCHD